MPTSRAWRISLALLVCFGVTSAALHTLLEGFTWWFVVAGTVIAVLGSAAAVRGSSARRWLPTVVGSVALIVVVTLFFAGRTAFLFVVPTFETLGVLGDLGQSGALSIARQSVPADLTVGISFLLCIASGSLAILADFLAVTWRRPALAALPLAVILGVPTFVGIALSDIFVVILSAIAWLVLLRAGQPFPQTARALALGAAAVAITLAAPLLLPQVDESQASGDSFSGYLAGVNPVLNLGADLRRELPRTILTYSTLSGAPTYLRLVSLQNFTAETWEPDPPDIDRHNLPSNVGAPPGLATDVHVEEETAWVDVNNLGSPWLPVPYPATLVSGVKGDWFWDAADLTFTSPDDVARGEEYEVHSLLVEPTPAQLESAGNIVPGGFAKYLALPEGLPRIIAEDAAQVASAATSNYGKAVALQEYFRDGSFTYSETAPVDEGYDGNGMEVIAKFLQARSGYCIHFASAMAVMARTLGIPSRVAVGLLPGEKQVELVEGRTQYRVTTQDIHAWPELYFDGVGWIRFEPTPGRGFVPAYADAQTPGVPATPTPTSTPSPTPSPTAAPSHSAAPEDPGTAEAAAGDESLALGWLWAVTIILGVLLILLVPAIVRFAQRSIRMRRLAGGWSLTDTGWRELLQTVRDLGVEVSSTATPREAAGDVAVAMRLDEHGRSVMDAVVSRVERESFAKSAPRRNSEEFSEQVRDLVRLMGVSAGTIVRLRARLAPRTVWQGLFGLTRAD